MQKPKSEKSRKVIILRWSIVLVIGAILGVKVMAPGIMMMRKTNTSFKQMIEPAFGGKKFVRILVMGEDNTSKMRESGRGLSDTLMVAAIDLDKNTVRAISVPRDTRVEIPGHGFAKINSAHVYGGPDLSIQKVEEVLGVKIDYYMKTNIAGLQGIVDLLGGIGIDIEKNLHYTDRAGGLYINLKKGYRHLNGEQALGYVRFRHDALGDITRIQRQQKFLRAIARHMLQPGNILKAPQIIDEMYDKGYIKTNLNLKDLEELISIAKNVPPDKMVMETAPGLCQNIDGASYFIVDEEAAHLLAGRLLEAGGNSAITAKIEVLNGTTTSGLAKDASDKLKEAGFSIESTGNAPKDDYDRTIIIVHTAESADGTGDIAKALGTGEVSRDPDGKPTPDGIDITVVIGSDYQR